MPAFFAANGENEILRAINIAREFNLKLTIVGATEGFRAPSGSGPTLPCGSLVTAPPSRAPGSWST